MRPAPAEPLRYHLACNMIGVSTRRAWLWAAIGGAWWFGPPMLAARLLGRAERRDALHRVERHWGRGLLRFLDVRLDRAGFEHIDPQRSYVVTPLHEGFADVPALLHLPLPLRFAARDELFGWRVLGPYLRDAGHVCVAPERGRWSYRELLRRSEGVFASGDSLVIFPQGTILGIETDFHPGAFTLARALRRPILPIALTGSHRVWEYPYTPRLRWGQRMSLQALPPIPADEVAATPPADLRRRVQRMVKAAALNDAMAAPRRFVPARDGYWDGFAYRIDPDFPGLAADVALHRAQVSARTARPGAAGDTAQVAER